MHRNVSMRPRYTWYVEKEVVWLFTMSLIDINFAPVVNM